ncbi:ComEC/Rec2 family competence protein [Croceibacterium aestuarii]|uniref:ComEC/Rec2 family competence protein n=1 Tax=Croceibacterium aestuarii TaxID=3064139 RepID=UPI00272ECD9F|nr:ComEC/Rec2 family competence protein [Croceibacterium sp. D39]
MATREAPLVPLGQEPGDAALQQTPWRMRARLSSFLDGADAFLARAAFDRGPWLAVALAGGIAAWFALPASAWWIGTIAAGMLAALGAVALWRGQERRVHLLTAVASTGALLAAGTALIWARSAAVGAEPFARPVSAVVEGRVLERIEQPAEDRTRLVLAARDRAGEAVKIRVNVPLDADREDFREGAVIRFKARLMPPASPMLPGGYDFARAAWFAGYAATGSVQGPVELVAPPASEAWLAPLQRRLAAHVRSRLGGSAGAIAAAFASGDRGAITTADEDAMRDAGLTHLLSISGLHVSAVIAAAYFLAMTVLAAWPWLALRVRLPVVAAGVGALAGIGYTLLTGAEVPTVRSCVGAVLVLGALALGREPLSLRMVAVAAVFVLLLWPESLAGPSFQMSFAAVVAIVALHNAGPVRASLGAREERLAMRILRGALGLLLTGVVIELALMPIVLFHFHRAGVYGAFANVLAIPLVTFVSMPLIALALLLDLVGLGLPVWWLAGQSLDLLLWIAHLAASQPGAVTLMPQMGWGTFALFVLGGLWLALWRGKERLWGLAAAGAATLSMLLTPAPDVLVSGDGRQVGIVTRDGRLLSLRDTKSEFTRDNLMELAGVEAEPVPLATWRGAECSRDFCTLTIERAGRSWRLLMARSRNMIEERALAAACERADIVVADRYLPRSCRPRALLADARTLGETGGVALVLGESGVDVTTVAASQGEHGWWHPRK